MWQLFKKNGDRVAIGDTLTTFKGNTYKVIGFEPPHKPAANGRVTVESCISYYVSVYDCEYRWICECKPEYGV